MSGYVFSHLDELDTIPVSHGLLWHPIRMRFDIRAFGMNAYTAEKVGDDVVEEHTEEQMGHEEVYVVISGRATFTVGDETREAPAGTIVYVSDPALKRKAVSKEEGTTVIAVGGKAGEAFVPSRWEWMFIADSQEPDAAVATMESAVAEFGEHPAVLYHLARHESRAGRTDDARAHLARALELRPGLREHADQDELLRPLS